MSKKVAHPPFAFPSPERAWQVAKLAAILATQHPFTAMDESSHPSQIEEEIPDRFRYESTSDLDDFYLSKVHLAEKLLNLAEEKLGGERFLFAYTLFDPTRRYSVLEIAEIFKSHAWKGLTSPNSVRALIKKCISELTQYYESELEYFVRESLLPAPGQQSPSVSNEEIKALVKRFTRKPINLEIVNKEKRIVDPLKNSIKRELRGLKELDENVGVEEAMTYSSVRVYPIFEAYVDRQLNWGSLFKHSYGY